MGKDAPKADCRRRLDNEPLAIETSPTSAPLQAQQAGNSRYSEAAFDDLVAWIENGTVPAGDDVLGDVRQLGLRWTPLRHPKDLRQ